MSLLDPVDGLTVEAGALAEGLLRQVRVKARGPDAIADSLAGSEDARRGRYGRHPLNARAIMIDCLYRRPYIL
ncbi:hypothetical protein [Streptomyces venezuelae]|uniref:hypothetical protein n=1 Tax=Streptomyces venezuelae TaxID=54571 RepID=UPI0036514DBF